MGKASGALALTVALLSLLAATAWASSAGATGSLLAPPPSPDASVAAVPPPSACTQPPVESGTIGTTRSLTLQAGGITAKYSGPLVETAFSYESIGYPGTIKITSSAGSVTQTLPGSVVPYVTLGRLCIDTFSATKLPAVILQSYSGGAHCCFGPEVYTSPATSYSLTEDIGGGAGAGLKWNGDFGFRFRSVDGVKMLASSDGAFNDDFTDFADDPAPVRLYTIKAGLIADVTAKHLDVVSAEATQFRATMAADKTNALGWAAAWVADECVLGLGARAWPLIVRWDDNGIFASGGNDPYSIGQFAPTLETFLLNNGYCSGQLP
jgi:hypothetical protein